LAHTIPKFDDLTGKSPQMKLVFRRIREAASSNVTVLILGESGTGKELVAQSIHRRSPWASGPFIPVNTGAISRDLVASELFGHQKGAFTGATETKHGKFEQAHEGTIFLDEIGTMDETTQISLLRVLETKRFQRIGGKRFIRCDARIIAASNENLMENHGGVNIREDLFHRLSVFTIVVNPLRERIEDLPIMAEELLNMACQEFHKEIRGFHPAAWEAMEGYSWPGNVREMKNVIQRAVLISQHREIQFEDLPSRIQQVKRHQMDISIPIGSSLKEAEKKIIQRTLQMTRGNRKHTAEILGISRRALYNKMHNFGIFYSKKE
jgi:DNA-binding NtrC family response regulator